MSKKLMVNEGASTSNSAPVSIELCDADLATTSQSNITQEKEKDDDNATSNSLKGWSKSEKQQLYTALKNHGTKDIANILCEVPTKSAIEIGNAIQHYKSLIKKPAVDETEQQAKQMNSSTPITNWANLLTEKLDVNDLDNEISESIRVYAEFGNIPEPHLTDNVNFRELYSLLADALDGKPLTSTNETHKQIIKECILNASVFSSEFVKSSNFENIFQNINVDDLNVSMVNKPSSDEELSCLRHLISQKKFNPLNLSEEDLKKSLDIIMKVPK